MVSDEDQSLNGTGIGKLLFCVKHIRIDQDSGPQGWADRIHDVTFLTADFSDMSGCHRHKEAEGILSMLF